MGTWESIVSNLFFLFAVLLTILYRLGVPVGNLWPYFRKHWQKYQAITKLRTIIHEGLRKTLCDYPIYNPETEKFSHGERYDSFMPMIEEVRRVQTDFLNGLPDEIRKNLDDLCCPITRKVHSAMGGGANPEAGFYNENVVKPLRKWKWLKLRL